MAGRAGRRGADPRWPSDHRRLGKLRRSGRRSAALLRRPRHELESQFRMTYGMILNLMRVEDLRVEVRRFWRARSRGVPRAERAARRARQARAGRGDGSERRARSAEEARPRRTRRRRRRGGARRGQASRCAPPRKASKAPVVMRCSRAGPRRAPGVRRARSACAVAHARERPGENDDDALSRARPIRSAARRCSLRDAARGGLRVARALPVRRRASAKTYVVLFSCPEGHAGRARRARRRRFPRSTSRSSA